MTSGALSVEAPAGLHLPGELVRDLEAAYRTPERHYHTIAHAWSVARWVMQAHAEHGFARVREAYVAALFHDAVYEVVRKDNEAKSADLARDALARYALGLDADWVAQLIARTAEHGRASGLAADELLFLDCDLASLGGDAEAYDRYEEGVASEYLAHVPEPMYRLGRTRFLEKLLARPRIFGSDYFYEKLEGQARENLTRALARG